MAHAKGGWLLWLEQWITSILVSLLFLVVFLVLKQNTAIFHTLERSEQDAAMRLSSVHFKNDSGPKVVFVTVDTPSFGSSLEDEKIKKDGFPRFNITQTLAEVLKANPKAVGIDFVVYDSVKKQHIQDLAAVVSKSPVPRPAKIVMPTADSGTEEYQSLLGQAGILTVPTPDFVPDRDGVIRKARERVCAATQTGHVFRTSFAAAILGEFELNNAGCVRATTDKEQVEEDVQDKTRVIEFVPVVTPDQRRPGVLMLPAASVSTHRGDIAGAYVIIGLANAWQTTDTFLTPVGMMPGALVQAQSLRTLAATGIGSSDKAVLSPRSAFAANIQAYQPIYDFMISLITAAISVTYTFWISKWIPCQNNGSFLSVFCSFITYGVFAIVFLLMVLVGATVFVTWLYSDFLIMGLVTAIIGSMIESLVHAGEHIVSPMQWIARWILRAHIREAGKQKPGAAAGSTLSAAFGLLLLSTGAAWARDCAWKLTEINPGGAKQDIFIDRQPLGALPAAIEPFQQVTVRGGETSVRLQRTGGGDTAIQLSGLGQPGGTVFVVPPCPPAEISLQGAWVAFWSVINPHDQQPLRSGATPVYRGFGRQPVIEGPLRDLDDLRLAAGTVVGVSGLSFIWAGGRPPYNVSVEDEVSRNPLAHAELKRPMLWLPEWTTPDQPFELIIRDAEGKELRHHWRPLPAAPVADADLGETIFLFETAPEYRLEVLRRLSGRAAASNVLAARALQAIQLSAPHE